MIALRYKNATKLFARTENYMAIFQFTFEPLAVQAGAAVHSASFAQ
jgi:hypothetical protein